MKEYKLIAENENSTVVSEIQKIETDYTAAAGHQTEAELEDLFVSRLISLGYERFEAADEKALIANLRLRLERLNGYAFTDSEWKRFYDTDLGNPSSDILEKTRMIQQDHIRLLTLDSGEKKNIYLLDKKSIPNNHVQVMRQYVATDGKYDNRYDVTILVNGLPLVHIELKRRGVNLREAFNQIERYQRDSFWSGSGLFEYAQLFVISNGTLTKYYSNTTRLRHVEEQKSGKRKPDGKPTASKSYEFTSYWATVNNDPILDLEDFTATFFRKNTLLNILIRYCVFTAEDVLLVMRPYQIAATEALLTRIITSGGLNREGTREAGGYIWHTTGSGKTLTSFKAAQLATQIEGIDKVLFVVDRKDLDYQTMLEYDRFEKGAANANSSTAELIRNLGDSDSKILITTIQKLSIFVERYRKHEAYDKRVVLIFDECHRSQFGKMHKEIVKRFRRYHIFGFTGTPIFADEAAASSAAVLGTTDQLFGDRLHAYTILDAVRDGNVLKFHVDYVSTMREKEEVEEKPVPDINREEALLAPGRISNVVRYVLDNFERKTRRDGPAYEHTFDLNIARQVADSGVEKKTQRRKTRGFNALFAAASIKAAKLYYSEFLRQMALLPEQKRLKLALIYSFGANEDPDSFTGLPDDENPESADRLDASSRDFLEEAIRRYNATFGTSYSTSADQFQNYYKDVSKRVKNRDVDLLIVVNMFLTGFDAPTLNTLFVDKNLRMHGLLQAFSRTNRILNSVKTQGEIVCFRNLEAATNKAIAAFGNKDARDIVLLRPFDDYFYGYETVDEDGNKKIYIGYIHLVEELREKFPPGQYILGEEAEKEFIRLYGSILKARNFLIYFDRFGPLDPFASDGNTALISSEMQNYQSIYLNLHDKWRPKGPGEKASIMDDVVFEMELIKQQEINIDYILYLLRDYRAKQTEVGLSEITSLIDSNPSLRNKKELLEAFMAQINPGSDGGLDDEWVTHVKGEMRRELDEVIEKEELQPEKTYAFMRDQLRQGYVQEHGTALPALLSKKISPFNKERPQIIRSLIDTFKAFLDRYLDISNETYI